MADLFINNSSGAIFSECRKYRYVLWRIWDENKPMAMYIGLNPSTANEREPDPTINKIGKVSKHNGFGGFYMLNLFAIISAEPEILLSNIDTIKDNDKYLLEYSKKVDAVIYCWGAFKEAKERAKVVRSMMWHTPLCFDHTKDGSPWHPLYCLDKSIFIPF